MKKGKRISIREMGTKLNLPYRLINSASSIYSKTRHNCSFEGRKPSVISAACIYLSALEHDFPMTLAEIHSELGVSESSTRSMVRYISDIFGIDLPTKHIRTTRTGVDYFTLYYTCKSKHKYQHKNKYKSRGITIEDRI
jgi:transcription initiation factor TFIIIB Brf1 subunit/transcription initiation factor TFIIB